MPDFIFDEEVTDTRHGRFTARLPEHEGLAEITFTRRKPGLISADHTGAPDSLRGTGAAAALVAHMVAHARAQRLRILPLCPYIRAQYRRNPDWADVMTLAPGENP